MDSLPLGPLAACDLRSAWCHYLHYGKWVLLLGMCRQGKQQDPVLLAWKGKSEVLGLQSSGVIAMTSAPSRGVGVRDSAGAERGVIGKPMLYAQYKV